MALRKLPDPWVVFYNVEWQAERGGRPGDGEADFVLHNPGVGLIIIEVKGGGISVGDGNWYSFDRDGRRHKIHDPFEQAKTSKYALIRHLKAPSDAPDFIPAGHAVAFPDLANPDTLGANAPAELMICRPDLADPLTAIDRIADHWELNGGLSTTTSDAVTELLAPAKTLRRTLRDDVAEVDAQIEHWTDDQAEALDALRRNPRQLIFGGAGTGKTVLAQEKAKRLAEEGKRVLLTCFNHPLAEQISRDLESIEAIEVASFHRLCRRLAKQAATVWRPGERRDSFAQRFPDRPDQDFWESGAPDLLVEAADFLGFSVDAVVVDEGQDFAPSWWAALELLLKEPSTGEYYVFADTHQAIYRQSWEPPFPGPSFELQKNCRNTLPIAEKVAAIYGDRASALVSSGVTPEFVEVVNEEGMVRTLRGVFHQLLNEGKLATSQVAVLCQRKSDVQTLRSLQIAGHSIVDLNAWGDGVLAETIHRFKGLEADACIVILWEVARPWDKALAYIGMSRPRAQLCVVASPLVKEALRWG